MKQTSETECLFLLVAAQLFQAVPHAPHTHQMKLQKRATELLEEALATDDDDAPETQPGHVLRTDGPISIGPDLHGDFEDIEIDEPASLPPPPALPAVVLAEPVVINTNG